MATKKRATEERAQRKDFDLLMVIDALERKEPIVSVSLPLTYASVYRAGEFSLQDGVLFRAYSPRCSSPIKAPV
jgi:hypothetical protein